MNTLPQSIPAFQFHIVFFESSTVTLSDHEYKEAIVSWENECARLRSKSQNDTASRNLTLPKEPDRTKKDWRCNHYIKGVEFFLRTTGIYDSREI